MYLHRQCFVSVHNSIRHLNIINYQHRAAELLIIRGQIKSFLIFINQKSSHVCFYGRRVAGWHYLQTEKKKSCRCGQLAESCCIDKSQGPKHINLLQDCHMCRISFCPATNKNIHCADFLLDFFPALAHLSFLGAVCLLRTSCEYSPACVPK